MNIKRIIMWIPIIGLIYGIFTIIGEGRIHLPPEQHLANGGYHPLMLLLFLAYLVL